MSRRARGALATMGVGPHEDLLDLALPSLQRYAALHGLDLHVAREHLVPERPISWSKVAMLGWLLDDYERVAWIDADAAIVDGSRDLTREVSRLRPLGMVVHRYQGLTVPNMGVLALRSCRLTKDVLGRIWRDTRYLEHEWWENAAMLDLLGYDVDAPRAETRRPSWVHRFVQPLDLAWNSIDLDPSPAPRIVHFPGTANGVRAERMRAALAAAAWWQEG